MGLVWTARVAGQHWVGHDVRGDQYAFVQASRGGRYRVFVSPRGCGHPDGLWLDGSWPTLDEATDAADRHVVAFVDGLPPAVDPAGHEVWDPPGSTGT